MVDIICFGVLLLISVIGICIVKKMKLPCWKFQIVWIALMNLLGVILLINQLKCD